MKTKLIFLIVLILLSQISFAQNNETQTVVVEGYGSVINNDVAMARDQAVRHARRNAVEQVAGVYLKSQTEVENFMLKSDKITTQTVGYIKSENILWEGEEGENLYKVKLEATVGTSELKNDMVALGFLIEQKGKPRIMVVIPEWHIPEGEALASVENRTSSKPNPSCETAVTSEFLQKGFTTVDQMQIAAIRDQQMVKSALQGQQEKLVSAAASYGAEVLIYGEAYSQRSEMDLDPMISCRATVNARAIRTDTGEIIATASKQAPGLDISEIAAGQKALQKAGQLLSTELIDKIIARWQRDVSSTTSVTLMIYGINFIQKNEFKTFLETEIRGVQSVQQRSFMAGNVEFTADIEGNAESLAVELMNKQNSLSFPIEVIGQSQNRVELNVIKQ